jgi:hypothetical protein
LSHKGCTRLAVASDKVYQLLAHCRWFSPGIPASSTTKAGRHDIAEILLKVALSYTVYLFVAPIREVGASEDSFEWWGCSLFNVFAYLYTHKSCVHDNIYNTRIVMVT